MKKGFILVATMLTACISLTGCHMKHEWQEATCTEPRTCTIGGETEGEPLGHTWLDATCTEPKTCSVCGETEGEPLGHTWTDATCTEPKTCSVCGETEGEPLGHTWVDANYQEPKTCSVCGEKEGEPLTASFEEHGLIINAEEGVTYDYVTACFNDKSKETIGHLTFSDYQISETCPFDEAKETPEGYEWRTVHVTAVYDDKNAQMYAASFTYVLTNYYEIESWDTKNDDGFCTVSYNGVNYTECKEAVDGRFGDWSNNTVTCNADFAFLVPIGYDGAVLGFINFANVEEDRYIYDMADDDTLFFRLN